MKKQNAPRTQAWALERELYRGHIEQLVTEMNLIKESLRAILYNTEKSAEWYDSRKGLIDIKNWSDRWEGWQGSNLK